jgi:hypothetical protein
MIVNRPVIIQSNVDFAKRSDLQGSTSIPATINFVRLNGYTDAGDAPVSLHKRSATEPSHAGKIQDSNNHWWELASTVVAPEMFGAFTSATDCTTEMQNCATVAAAINAVVDGHGRVYNVGTISWPSGSVVRNLRLKSIAATTDFTAPITIDGNSVAKSRLRFTNVHVDGNRANHTSIVTTTEDGGRHGWRIVGRVSNLTAIDCSAVDCAGDGLMLFSSTARGSTDADYSFSDITFKATGNRRHGWSADSFTNLRFIGGKFKDNGKDLNEVDAYTYGTRGARSTGALSGLLYGRPFDVEDYGIGSGWDGLWISDADCRDNITGALFHAHIGSDPTDGDFTTRRNLYMRGCQLDEPSGGVSAFPIDVYSAYGAAGGTELVFENLNFQDCFMDGNRLAIRNASGGVSGGFINPGVGATVKAVMTSAPNFIVSSPSTAAAVTYGTAPAGIKTAVAHISGAGWSAASESVTLIEVLPSGSVRYRYRVTLTPDAAETAGFRVVFTDDWYVHDVCLTSAITSSNGIPVSAAAAFPSAADNESMDFWLTSTNTFAIAININLTLKRMA